MGFPLMERIVYEQMAELDQRHWWYRARREVLAALIRRTVQPAEASARSSRSAAAPGHNLAMLGQFGQVDALELDDEARAIAEKRARPSGHERAAARARRRSRTAPTT